MALPLIAAGIAARALGKKLASRAAGGITGKGAKSVNPVYKNQTDQIQKNSVKVNKNSMDIVSKGLGNKTIRQEISKFKNIVNDAGLKKAQSRGPRPSVKVIKKP